MIVHSSALLAIVLAEPDARRYAGAVAAAGRGRISAVNWLEASAVVEERGDPVASRRFDEILREARLEIAPVTPAQAKLARRAWRDYGAGRHPAGLSLTDCLAYALARSEHEPLLFKGDAFAHTDIEPALKD